jgi:hypothetical protein
MVPEQLSPEEAVRAFFDCYSNGKPEDFDKCVAADYTDYGHTPPGIGPSGARDDYEGVLKRIGGLVKYTINALVVDGEVVAAVWTGHLPNGDAVQGLSVYRVADGLLRSARNALVSN